ncbi:CBU_0592 family membrane protein [Ferruginibacter albus]|uniref:CBU_0592 family membrane protein n=1 Tax=Ferruginibacter albus TaxID=2875540 RepID=UPI001CC6DDB2|nr:hypothetical protein [Ferruginibacter albus]UAY51063.1 hypothetical protein K9M53_10725 [Ferruginibacter albus]
MSIIDWIGFAGVTILLTAYFLNLAGKISNDSTIYIVLNIAGGSIACIASILLHYIPFIILETAWTLVSIVGLLNRRKPSN